MLQLLHLLHLQQAQLDTTSICSSESMLFCAFARLGFHMPENKDNKVSSDVRVSAFINPELHRRWRMQMLDRRETMQDVIESLIAKYCDGVEIRSSEATEDEQLVYCGMIAWMRDQGNSMFWKALIEEWRDRGRLIKAQQQE